MSWFVRLGLCLLTAPWLAGCLSLDMFLFLGAPPEEDYDFSESTIPESLIEEHTITTEDGPQIHAFWASQPQRAPTVLYCHGQNPNISEYWDRVEILHGLGANVLIFDYQGYGLSEGETSEENTQEDARAARALLRQMAVPDEQVFYYGYSLGASVCLALAVEDPPAGLVLESAFASIAHLARSGSGLDFGPGWLSDSLYDNVAAAATLEAPLVLLHGVEDDFVPISHGRRVFTAAPEPKRALWVEGADHGEVPSMAGDEYDALVTALMTSAWPDPS